LRVGAQQIWQSNRACFRDRKVSGTRCMSVAPASSNRAFAMRAERGLVWSVSRSEEA
jgi:hypothetical protein